MSLQISNSTSFLLQNFDFTSLLPQNFVNTTLEIPSRIENLFKKFPEFNFDSGVVSLIDLKDLMPVVSDKKNIGSLINLIKNDISINYGLLVAPIKIQLFPAHRRQQGDNERLQIRRQDVRERQAAEQRDRQQRQNEAQNFIAHYGPVGRQGEGRFMRGLRALADGIKLGFETLTYVSACLNLIRRFLGR